MFFLLDFTTHLGRDQYGQAAITTGFIHKSREKKVTCNLATRNLFKRAAGKIPWTWIYTHFFWHISYHVPSGDAFCGAAGNFSTGGAEDPQALRGGSHEMLTRSNRCVTLCIYTEESTYPGRIYPTQLQALN